MMKRRILVTVLTLILCMSLSVNVLHVTHQSPGGLLEEVRVC